MNYIMQSIPIIITSISIYIIGVNINKISNNGIFFGLRVPLEFRSNEELNLLVKKYNKLLLFYILISLFISLIINAFNTNLGLLINVYILLFALIIPYSKANKEMKKLKIKLGWKSLSRNKVILAMDNKKNITFNSWWFIIPSILGFINLVETFLFYPKKEVQIPLHFDFSGNITNYGISTSLNTKVSIFMLPIISLLTVLISILIIKFLVSKGIRLNGGKPSDLLKEKSLFKHDITLLFYFTSLSISGLFLFLTSKILNVFYISVNVFITLNILFIIPLIIIPIFFLVRLTKIRNSTTSSNEEEIYKDDDDFYKLGLLYYNPNDPSLMIEKRVGVGYDFNYAKWPAKIFLVIISFILVYSLVVTL